MKAVGLAEFQERLVLKHPDSTRWAHRPNSRISEIADFSGLEFPLVSV